jgi:hypothetical protein
MRRTEQAAVVNVALSAVCRPCPRHSFPAVHDTYHSIQGRAENAKLNEEPASNQRSDTVSPTPAGLEGQNLVDRPTPGYWNMNGQGGIHLGSSGSLTRTFLTGCHCLVQTGFRAK